MTYREIKEKIKTDQTKIQVKKTKRKKKLKKKNNPRYQNFK